MDKRQKLIKVAFWYDRPVEYSGGLNYLKNLLYALSRIPNSRIQPYIFFGKTVNTDVVRPFEELATVVRSSILDRKSFAWFGHQILHRIFGSLGLVEWAMRPHGIAVVSHAANLAGARRRMRIISWIPDFQYLHLPELFPRDAREESLRLLKLVNGSDALVLSSRSALSDFNQICHGDTQRPVVVLPFVSQSQAAQNNSTESDQSVLKRHGIQGRFFFLPNQFWKHKNHAVVFAAVRELKSRGHDVLVVCSGNLRDYRVRDYNYVDGLLRFIEEHDLSRNILVLGQIDYADVLALMRLSIAVINPSLFEGWSSSVEETRSIGQRLIISALPVHREQAPPHATYFQPDSVEELSSIMEAHWLDASYLLTDSATREAAIDLTRRTLAYGLAYEKLVAALESRALDNRVYVDANQLPG